LIIYQDGQVPACLVGVKSKCVHQNKMHNVISNTPFTWSSNRQANIEQTWSRHRANVKQTSNEYKHA